MSLNGCAHGLADLLCTPVVDSMHRRVGMRRAELRTKLQKVPPALLRVATWTRGLTRVHHHRSHKHSPSPLRKRSTPDASCSSGAACVISVSVLTASQPITHVALTPPPGPPELLELDRLSCAPPAELVSGNPPAISHCHMLTQSRSDRQASSWKPRSHAGSADRHEAACKAVNAEKRIC